MPYLCHISPYAYCAADPINLTDPTGMTFTDEAKVWANDIKKIAKDRINRNNKNIESNNEKLKSGELSPIEIKNIEKQVQTLQAQNEELGNAISEINILDESTQLYDVKTSDKNGLGIGTTEFDPSSGMVIAFLPTDTDIPLAAHEFKHFFQFENGEITLGKGRECYNLYDKTDELAAYKRGEAFGGDSYKGISDLPYQYNSWPDSNRNINNHQSYQPFLKLPIERQCRFYDLNFSKRCKFVFRVNGNTFYNK